VVHSSTTHRAAGGAGPTAATIVPEVLIEQHRRLRELLDEVREADDEQRARPFDRLRRLLAAHETAEEIVVRPVSKQIMDRDSVAERNHEERRIMRLLAVLEKLDTDGPEFEERFRTFADTLHSHMTLEERVEFPALESELTEADRTAMGRWIVRAVTLGPTHAHPRAFGSPLLERALTPINALVDHARDAHRRSENTSD
jgi:hemerythrin superfamily protein